jgi:hypothetical protein
MDSIIGTILGTIGNVLDRVIPDKNKRAEAQEALEAAFQSNEFQLALGQIQINQQEAQSSNLFVAGWRPFIGWGCGFALLYASILEPFIRFIAIVLFHYNGAFPVIDTNLTLQVLLGLLGLAGLRSWDKKNGTAK